MCAWNTHMLKYPYLRAGPLCGWAGYIDRYLVCVCVCVLCLCVYAQPRRASLSDGSCLFVADRCSLLTRSKSDERRGCSLKFRYLPLDSSVDPLCCGSSCPMSHQLTGLIGRDSQIEKIFSSVRLYSSESFILLLFASSLRETGEYF